MSERKVYKKLLAIELRKMGFKIIRTEVNPYKPIFDVYIFEDSPRLDEAFSVALKRVEEYKQIKAMQVYGNSKE